MNIKRKTGIWPIALLLALTTSCGAPTMSNVTIDDNYVMNYSYMNLVGDEEFDYYWPELTIHNKSADIAFITFSYAFYVFETRLTDPSLNRTVTYEAPKGDSVWEMPEAEQLMISSYYSDGEVTISVDHVDFTWEVEAVDILPPLTL